MYVIVGLGNPDKKYEHTRHNIGFNVVTRIADDHNISLNIKEHKAICGKGFINGQKVLLALPQTYMNLSGEAVRALVDYYKIDPEEELIVIYDDISMDVGRIRMRAKGSAGGHNGIKNIIAHLGTDVFARIKIGVGAKPAQVEEYRNGKTNLLGFFVGQVMKETKGRANPKTVNEFIRKFLEG